MSLSQLKKNGKLPSLMLMFHVTVSSRRDDLEQMLYTLVFLAKGDLPWSLKKNYSTQDIIKAKSCSKIIDLMLGDLPSKSLTDYLKCI